MCQKPTPPSHQSIWTRYTQVARLFIQQEIAVIACTLRLWWEKDKSFPFCSLFLIFGIYLDLFPSPGGRGLLWLSEEGCSLFYFFGSHFAFKVNFCVPQAYEWFEFVHLLGDFSLALNCFEMKDCKWGFFFNIFKSTHFYRRLLTGLLEAATYGNRNKVWLRINTSWKLQEY